jgi:UDP-N-acetylmuramoylalanine--D-glutamate ligase
MHLDGELPRSQFHFLWPNLGVNIFPGKPNISIGPMVPLTPDRTYRFLDYFFGPEVDQAWIDELMAFDDQVGIEDKALATALTTFRGVEHRLELVRDHRGVRYVNDSKATNTAAARRGIAAYAAEPLRLILGGSLKGESFDELAAALPASVRSVDLIGEASDTIAASLGRAGRSYRRSDSLVDAIAAIARDAEPGDVVLLSPACASYDQYRNYEERGNAFRRLVEELA